MLIYQVCFSKETLPSFLCVSRLALAYYAQLTNRGIRALYFAQKAVICSGFRNLEALICKGNILLDLGNKQEACVVFREATQMCSYRYEPHKGLVDAYIAMQRFRDASTIATHACKKLGETPRVLTVYTFTLLI